MSLIVNVTLAHYQNVLLTHTFYLSTTENIQGVCTSMQRVIYRQQQKQQNV